MNKITIIFAIAIISLLTFGIANAQTANLITENSAGKVKLGMTVAQVRKAVAPMKLSRTSDGEGVASIAVKSGKKELMYLYAEEDDPASKLNERAKIKQIWVWDKTFKTAAGVHPGMLLAEAEKKYGGVQDIMLTEIESREFVNFKKHPKRIVFRVQGKDDNAGAYPPNSNRATSFNPGSYIFSINVVDRDFTQGEPVEAGVTFSSDYTDLKTGCKSEGGEEGGHVSTFCKGPGGYQVHYFDAATVYQLNIADAKREWEKPVTMLGLDLLKKTVPVEWRLADGKPFAVIFTHPGTGKAIVRGLKGFERINERINANTSDANVKVREAADKLFAKEYADIIITATPIGFAANSTEATVKGKIAAFDDALKYVVKAKAGDRLTVQTKADKWTGEEGPILIVFVRMPDGKEDGQPGGFDDVLTKDGDYEIVVKQNAAKSRAANIELKMTVTLKPKG